MIFTSLFFQGERGRTVGFFLRRFVDFFESLFSVCGPSYFEIVHSIFFSFFLVFFLCRVTMEKL